MYIIITHNHWEPWIYRYTRLLRICFSGSKMIIKQSSRSCVQNLWKSCRFWEQIYIIISQSNVGLANIHQTTRLMWHYTSPWITWVLKKQSQSRESRVISALMRDPRDPRMDFVRGSRDPRTRAKGVPPLRTNFVRGSRGSRQKPKFGRGHVTLALVRRGTSRVESWA